MMLKKLTMTVGPGLLLGLGAISAPPALGQSLVECEGASCEVLPGKTLLVHGNSKKEFRNLNLRGGHVKVEQGGQLTVSGTLLGQQGSIENSGKIVFRGGRTWGLGNLSSFTSTGEIELNQTSLNWDGAIGSHSNHGKITLKGDSTLEITSVLNNGGDNAPGLIHVTGGSKLIIPGDAQAFKTKGLFGGRLQVDEGGDLVFAHGGGTIGSRLRPTEVILDGEMVIPPSAPSQFPPRAWWSTAVTVPDPALCTVTGSLTTGTGTFTTTIKRMSTTPLVFNYGQLAVYGNFVLNGGTLKVLEDPSSPNFAPPSTALFDIIWADDILANDGGPVGFTAFTERASEYSQRSIVTLSGPSEVYRIVDP